MTAPSPPADLLDELPGEVMIWVLIISELLVFGAGLAVFLALRLRDPSGFAAAQTHLHAGLAGVNTALLVTSGYLAALATRRSHAGQGARLPLAGAAALGLGFLVIKASEYAALNASGIGIEAHVFFTFYYLLTGFHAAHVAAGIVLFGLVSRFNTPQNIATASAFWHMVDLVWVILFPVLYLLR